MSKRDEQGGGLPPPFDLSKCRTLATVPYNARPKAIEPALQDLGPEYLHTIPGFKSGGAE